MVVGIGISGIPQVTLETVASIKRADQLYYLALDPVSELWLRRLNPSAETLQDLYGPGKLRSTTYKEMTARITSAVFDGKRVCVAFYGHPAVLVRASHESVKAVRRAGMPAEILPGISAEACLYSDLGVDPGKHGMQSFEATDFLLYRRRVDPTSGLILWQIGVLGEAITRHPSKSLSRPRMRVLVSRLTRQYPPTHKVVVYQAATVPGRTARIRSIELDRLDRARIAPLSTLYIPPLAQRAPSPAVLEWLKAT